MNEMGFAPKAIYNRLYYGLYWRNGEVCAGATFGDRRVDELAVFLGQTCDFSGRSWIAPLSEGGKKKNSYCHQIPRLQFEIE